MVATSDTPDPVRVGEDLTYDVLVVNPKLEELTGVRLSSSSLPVDAGFDVIPSQGGHAPQSCGEILRTSSVPSESYTDAAVSHGTKVQ